MNIYFSGMGGAGIGPLVRIARDCGHTVFGSDLTENLITRELTAQGVDVAIGQDGSHLQNMHDMHGIDWFVYTAALPATHPELVLAQTLGIRSSKRDELLATLIAEKDLKLIAIAGTHGKTTTTSMFVWAMMQLGIPVSYSIGSTTTFGPSGVYTPGSEYFVYECDEFDRNFLHFTPYLSLITSVEYDHPDTYASAADYDAAFAQFASQSGHVVRWDFPNLAPAGNEWVLGADEVQAVALAGEHNRANATLVIKGLEYLKLCDNPRGREILATFPGAQRRFEKLADNLYTDYGHTPTEIAATLQLARELSDHVVLVYQPHQNVRQHEIRDQYTNQFERAEAVYWLPTYLSRENPNLPVLTYPDLSRNITNPEAITPMGMNDALWTLIQSARARGALVLCMGAGSIDAWVREKLQSE